MIFYLIRHGETLFNIQKRMQGWCDSPLTEKGIEQAKNAGIMLGNIDFEYAYSSTSERAVDTLNFIIENRNIPSSSLKGLKEVYFGSLEGEKEEYVINTMKLTHDAGILYGGETKAMALARVKETLLELSKKHNENVLVVSHGGIILDFYRELTGDTSKQSGLLKPFPNGKGIKVECDGNTFTLLGRVE